jgi:PTS system mannose-specific IID component
MKETIMMNEQKNTPATNEKYHVTAKDLRQTAFRWRWYCVNLFNYETQEGPGVALALAPVLRKIYPKDEDYKAAMENHFKYFNTTPSMAPLLLGATLAMEEKDGIQSKDTVQSFKTSMMGPLAGIGDTVFWVLWPTIMGSLAGYMALQGNPLGAIVWFICNIIIYLLNFWFIRLGYTSGTKLIDNLGDRLTMFTDAASVMGLTVIGSLVATVVKVSTPLVYHSGKVKLALQSGVLDKIMPALLPVLLTFIVYKLVGSKKWTPTRVIFLVIALALVGTFFGIFKA